MIECFNESSLTRMADPGKGEMGLFNKEVINNRHSSMDGSSLLKEFSPHEGQEIG